jgi:HEPN domain-containing protein
MKKQAEGWIEAAHDDLLVIEEIINHDGLTHMVAFHAQQAIEKAFKALFEGLGKPVPTIHDLITLRGQIKENIDIKMDIDLAEAMHSLAKKIYEAIKRA